MDRFPILSYNKNSQPLQSLFRPVVAVLHLEKSMTSSLSNPYPFVETPEAIVPPHKRTHRRLLRFLLPISILMAGVGAASVYHFRTEMKTDVLPLSGRIEGYPANVNVRGAGRIETLTVREGDRVQQGEVIAQLDDAELQAQLDGATARLTSAQQQQQQAQLQIAVVQSQIQAAQLTRQQTTGEAGGRIAQAEADVATAEAQLVQTQAQRDQAQAELALSQADRDRLAQLRREGAITQQQLDQAQTAFDTAQAVLQSQEAAIVAAQRQVNAAQGALTQAQTSRFNSDIQTTQLDGLQRQLEIARSQLATAQADVASATAARQEILARIEELQIVSPLDGVVITRSAEPGTVVTSGTTLITVLDPEEVYLRGFIPAGEIGRVRVGQTAQVYLDSDTDRPLTAQVSAIDAQASFTPENIYFREDRVQQVFGVNLRLENPDGFAKPGLPADAEIGLGEDAV
jgi:HlyD family secretion protein